MPQLINKENNQALASDLRKAKTLGERIKGLIGRKNLQEKEALWISACPSIHTFFMKFPIDVIFTDKNFQIVSLFENVPSGKFLWGGFKSQNVFEVKTGQIKKAKLKKGDFLYVEY